LADEFQQTGDVRPGEGGSNGRFDSLLGITTAAATEAGGFVTIPVAAVGGCGWQAAVFVKTAASLLTRVSNSDKVPVQGDQIASD